MDAVSHAAAQRLPAVAAVVDAQVVEVSDDVREHILRTIPELRIQEHRVDIELALRVCQVLGSVVLRPPSGSA